MKIIKGVLEEELQNSLHMQEEYEKALSSLPRGVLVKKVIKGYSYYYLMMREGSKVRFDYKGKVSGKEIKRYDDAKKDRARYRKLLGDVKKQVSFLRRALRGKELRAVS
jgi:hypothetical protein